MSQRGLMRKYRWSLSHYLLQSVPILANMLLLVFVIYGFIILSGLVIHAQSLPVLWLLPVFLVVPVAGVLQIILFIVRVGSLVASYVVVSPDALEIRLWPLYHLRLRWEDAASVREPSGEGESDEVLSLKKAKELDEGSTVVWLRKVLRRFVGDAPRFLSLQTIQGHSQGGFADDLRRYAPHLFAAE
jgi:hypothetical protein